MWLMQKPLSLTSFIGYLPQISFNPNPQYLQISAYPPRCDPNVPTSIRLMSNLAPQQNKPLFNNIDCKWRICTFCKVVLFTDIAGNFLMTCSEISWSGGSKHNVLALYTNEYLALIYHHLISRNDLRGFCYFAPESSQQFFLFVNGFKQWLLV